ncbi:MAG: 4Fe-4S dicluster domain-containing protein [Syntrophomonadaceae bacterium]|nr:4Fe-4S dicluster domain-containing protein [Syntrophomonadaceae bacterium]
MEIYVLPKQEMGGFVAGLAARYEVLGPVAKEEEFVFAPVSSAAELRLDYDTTILPPHKKYFLPPMETLFTFDGRASGREVEPAVGERVLFGVHACDVNGLLSLDQVFLGSYPDPYYRARRASTAIIGLNCTEPCENGFCSSFNTGPGMDRGYDLALTDIGEAFLVEVGSERGKELAKGLAPASDEHLIAKNRALRAAQQMITRRIDTEGLAQLLHENVEHAEWEELAEICLSCGSCTNVCPTCFCFGVKDYVELDLTTGTRPREWDSCQFYEFSRVAMDHVFRPGRPARIKQRMYHKLTYFQQQFDAPGCVGCGRCVTYCIVDIDPVEIVENIQENPNPGKEVHLYTPPPRRECPDTSPWKPLPAVIKGIKKQTADTTTYTLAFQDPKVQEAYTYQPGVFNMVSLFGLGEAPISISSSADTRGSFDHTIRAVGNVTNALEKCQVGDVIGIRGPYGRGWPVEEMEGKNVLLIAGGIGLAPLRPVIKHIQARRDRYGSLEILYGARTPADMLFTDEFDEWRAIPDTKLYLTVDRADPADCWQFNVGVVTTLCDLMAAVPENTVVVTCGPDIMMKFVVKTLLGRGFSPEQIFVSLERRMSCGIKKCGNCQIGPVFVCQDGPVFRYSDVQDLPEEIL